MIKHRYQCWPSPDGESTNLDGSTTLEQQHRCQHREFCGDCMGMLATLSTKPYRRKIRCACHTMAQASSASHSTCHKPTRTAHVPSLPSVPTPPPLRLGAAGAVSVSRIAQGVRGGATAELIRRSDQRHLIPETTRAQHRAPHCARSGEQGSVPCRRRSSSRRRRIRRLKPKYTQRTGKAMSFCAPTHHTNHIRPRAKHMEV